MRSIELQIIFFIFLLLYLDLLRSTSQSKTFSKANRRSTIITFAVGLSKYEHKIHPLTQFVHCCFRRNVWKYQRSRLEAVNRPTDNAMSKWKWKNGYQLFAQYSQLTGKTHPLKTGVELGCFIRVGSSFSTCGIYRIPLVRNHSACTVIHF